MIIELNFQIFNLNLKCYKIQFNEMKKINIYIFVFLIENSIFILNFHLLNLHGLLNNNFYKLFHYR